MSRYKKIIEDGKASLAQVPEFLEQKSWEDIKSLVRQRISDLRAAQRTLTAAISEERIRKQAEKVYDQFKRSIEDLDLAARQKNTDRVRKAQQQALQFLQEWASATGISI
eukprot:jgi/Galph1/5277/GphlegSOOS_G3989.1